MVTAGQFKTKCKGDKVIQARELYDSRACMTLLYVSVILDSRPTVYADSLTW